MRSPPFFLLASLLQLRLDYQLTILGPNFCSLAGTNQMRPIALFTLVASAGVNTPMTLTNLTLWAGNCKSLCIELLLCRVDWSKGILQAGHLQNVGLLAGVLAGMLLAMLCHVNSPFYLLVDLRCSFIWKLLWHF
jgi:hypothetical protein